MILALNCGSSSVKYQLFHSKKHHILCKGVVERVGHAKSYVIHEPEGKNLVKIEKNCPDYQLAIKLILDSLQDPQYGVIGNIQEIKAVGHRVVHGGEKFSGSQKIDKNVLLAIKSLANLAPLHNPSNIAGIESAQAVLSNVPHIAVFDTAFHQTIPEYAYRYAIPKEWLTEYGVRRYGFHGTSHLYVSQKALTFLKIPTLGSKLISLHIGNGVSVTAIKDGLSVDTSMGFTPLEGAIMGTRSGDIDPAIVSYVAQKLNTPASDIISLLNKKSGLLAITEQYTDQRDILAGAKEGDTRCQLALEMETYRLRKYIGAYSAAMGGLDAVIFTAGVGENNSVVREKTLQGLEYIGVSLDLSKNSSVLKPSQTIDISKENSLVKILVIPTNEELVFIEDVVAILENRYHEKGNHYSFSN